MELLLIFLGGLLGSSHCLGMCGGFALSIGTASAGLRSNLVRQSVYSLGRIFTYAAAGAAAGYGGWRLVRGVPPWVDVQAVLAIAAGVLLVVQGLASSGLLHGIRVGRRSVTCTSSRLFAPFLTARGLKNAFLAGVLTGLLPCGLVYAFLALAISSGSVLGGLVRMACFGLGTAPLMMLVGCSGSLVGLVARQRLQRVAACCVLLTGVLSIIRGVGFIPTPMRDAACPFCRQAQTMDFPSPPGSRIQTP